MTKEIDEIRKEILKILDSQSNSCIDPSQQSQTVPHENQQQIPQQQFQQINQQVIPEPIQLNNEQNISQDLSSTSPTGIIEFDKLLGGGFPKGSAVLVSGNSGTGKTIFSFEWLFNGVNKFNENGIYVTFTEPLFKTLKNLEVLSFYDKNVIEEEKIKILDIRKELGHADFDEKEILNFIEAEVKKIDAKRLIIDSITAIAYNLYEKARIRRFIFELGTTLATLGCTTLLTSEVTTDQYSVYGVEEFISDGILKFKKEEHEYQLDRTLEIAKMRGIKFQEGSSSFRITSDGINIFPSLKIPLIYPSPRKKISIGIKGIDEMTNGGIYEGSISLVAGSTGAGKSITGLHFIWEGLKNNEPCLLVGFEESREQILRNASVFGWDLEKFEKEGLLTIICSYPTEKYIEEHLLFIKKIIDTSGIKRCVIDSLSAIGNSFKKEKFRYFVKILNAYLKSKSVTSIFTTVTANLMTIESTTEAHLSTITDNIILLKYVEAGGEIKLMAALLKTRGDDHSKSLREYEITNKGIVIGESFKGYEKILMGSAKKVGSTIHEQLIDIFTEFLGPIGLTEFNDLKEKGQLKEDNILEFIDSLIEEGSLNPEKGEAMRMKLYTVFERSPDFYRNNESGNEKNNTIKHPDNENKKSFSETFFRRKSEEK